MHDEEAYQQDEKSWDVAEARLKAKSQLYDKMSILHYKLYCGLLGSVRGEVTRSYDDDDEDKSTYLVDFENKSWQERDDQDNYHTPSMRSYDMDQEEERRKWEDEYYKEVEEAEQRKQRIRMAEQLNQDTRKGRSKHIEMKVKRKQELEARLRIIKEKEIKRKLGNTSEAQQEEPPVGPKLEMYDPEAADEEEEPPALETPADREVHQQQQIERSINELFRSVKQEMYH
jgi:hypothetical protein